MNILWLKCYSPRNTGKVKNFSLFFSEKKVQVDCQNEHLRIDAG